MAHRSAMQRNRVHAKTNFLAGARPIRKQSREKPCGKSTEQMRADLEAFLKSIGKDPKGYLNG